MRSFNEWLTQSTNEADVITNQLEQLVGKVAGVLQYAEESKKEALIEKFIQDVKNLNEKV